MGYKLKFHHKIFRAYIHINTGRKSTYKTNCFVFWSGEEVVTTRSGVMSYLPKTT